MTKNEKISLSLKKYYSENVHPSKGKKGWKHSDEMKEHKRKKSLEYWDKKGRMTRKEKLAKNKSNVYAYNARKNDAIPDDADLKLIRKIYENCPDGYHVDHIKALAAGGTHHQDNLQYLEISENCRKGMGDVYDKSKAIPWKKIISPDYSGR